MTDQDLQEIAARNVRLKSRRTPHAGRLTLTAADPVDRDINDLLAEVRRLREAIDGVLAVDIKYQWRILTNEAATRFLRLQQVREGTA